MYSIYILIYVLYLLLNDPFLSQILFTFISWKIWIILLQIRNAILNFSWRWFGFSDSFGHRQKYSRLRCLLGLMICFYLGWSGSILQFRQNMIRVGSKSWLFICSSNITLSLPSYTGSALKRELNFCNGYLSLLYFWEGCTG